MAQKDLLIKRTGKNREKAGKNGEKRPCNHLLLLIIYLSISHEGGLCLRCGYGSQAGDEPFGGKTKTRRKKHVCSNHET
ncbi:MAG: hypothetical protein II564_04440, partial [Oscillospiraceae bacterium]|nr:hypothetical protein [Oscillospiraceae bacterium]